MTKGDFVASQALGNAVEGTTPHLGAQIAGRNDGFVGDGEDIGGNDRRGNFQGFEVFLDLLPVFLVVAGVHDQIRDLKREFGVAMEVFEKKGEHHRVFPAGDADADFIIRLQKLINRQSFCEFPIDLVLKSGVERALDLFGSR